MNGTVDQRWGGDYAFLIRNIISKDFKVRYRNMSLGVLWSLANPLVMMGVLTFVFTRIFPNPGEKNYSVFVLCGLVPFNFFAIAWVTGTTSLIENAQLVKRIRFPREIIPVATVLANVVHFGIQIALLVALVLAAGYGVNAYWLWLPVVFFLEIVFVCGLALMFSALDVYVRDIRYLVESFNTVLFWLVPIFYSFTLIPLQYKEIYEINPMAAVVLAVRRIVLEAQSPGTTLLIKLSLVSFLLLGLGVAVFHRLKRRFYDYL